MEMSPAMPEMGPMRFAEGGLVDVAQYLASKGRNGDSILAHITPAEARLLKSMGGSGTINPQTGLPEFFLKKLFKGVKKAVKKVLKNPIVRIVATVALATVLGPAGAAVVGSKAAAAALASGAVTAASGGKLKDVLVASATGYFGAGGTVGRINPASAVASGVGQFVPGGATGAVAQGIGAGAVGTGLGLLSGMRPEEALKAGAMQGVIAGGTQAAQNYLGNRALQEVEVTGKKVPVPGAPAPSPTAPNAQATAGGAEELITRHDGKSHFPGPAQGAAPATPGPATSAIEYRPPGTTYAADLAAGRFVPDTQVATAMPTTAAPSTFGERVGEFFSKPSVGAFKDAFLINPNEDPGKLARYVPGVATALAVTGATGGFKAGKAEENPLFDRDYTGRDFMRDNPELFKGGFDMPKAEEYNPVVPTPSYGSAPGSEIPIYAPPPPLLYQNPARPTGYAKGGNVQPQGMSPVNVAQTEAALFAGPAAAQQARTAVSQMQNKGIMGVQRFNEGGQPTHFPRKNGAINGPGTGTSDSIPAMLSDGEFVFTAKAVRNAGGGSRRKGARRMYKLMKMLEGGDVKGK
jgi:hypothetical protein